MRLQEFRFDTLEQLEQLLCGQEMEVLQLSPGALDFTSTRVDLGGIVLEWNRTGATIRSIETYNRHGLMFGFVRQSPRPLKSYGHIFDEGYAVVWPANDPLEYIAPQGLTSLVIHVSPALVDLLGWNIHGPAWLRVPSPRLARLEAGCHLATRAAGRANDVATDSGAGNVADLAMTRWRDRILADLDSALQPWLTLPSSAGRTIPGSRYFRLFQEAERVFAQYDQDETIPIDAIAAQVGVPRRTLFHAFRQYLGMGPYGYLQLVRLHRLRDELLAVSPERSTVTAIASGLGFGNVGRAAAAYKAQFGEYPHETLQRR